VYVRPAQHHTRVRIATLRGKWPAYQLWMICCFPPSPSLPPSLPQQYKVSYKINPPLVARAAKCNTGCEREGDGCCTAQCKEHNGRESKEEMNFSSAVSLGKTIGVCVLRDKK